MQQIILTNVRLGADPELKYTPQGTAICRLSVADTEKWRSEDGELQERTTWFRISAFGRQAEVLNQYAYKGGRINIVGTIRTDKYTDEAGVERHTWEVKPIRFELIDFRSADDGVAEEGTSAPWE